MSRKIESPAALTEAVKKLKEPVVVAGHIGADGDCVGSIVGLVELLRSLGKEACGMTCDKIPDALRFLIAGVPWREPQRPSVEGCTIVSVDTPRRFMLGFLAASEPLPEIALAIDHHMAPDEFARELYLDSQSSSASQIVAELTRLMRDDIGLSAANALYAGMIADTYRFAYNNGGDEFARTLEVAAWLSRHGAATRELNDFLTNTVTVGYWRLRSLALQKADFLEGGKLVSVGLDEDDFRGVGASPDCKDMLAADLRSIEGVQISALIVYSGGLGKGSVRGRLESYRVDILASHFGGGGHKAAAGIRNIQEPPEIFLPRLKESLVSHWKTYGAAAPPPVCLRKKGNE